MTTEDDFQAALDRDVTDWQTRLVLADFLQEHGDPRAAGYRALGQLQIWPHVWTGQHGHLKGLTLFGYHNGHGIVPDQTKRRISWHSVLPPAWHRACFRGEAQVWVLCHDLGNLTHARRNLEDIAVRAFLDLPVQTQEGLVRSGLSRLRLSEVFR